VGEEIDGFRATDEQEAFRAAVRGMARTRLSPGYLERARSTEFPWSELRDVAGLGVLSLLTDPDLGGPEEPEYVAAGIACEELAYGDFNVANLVIPPLIVSYIISSFADEPLRRKWLPRLAGGHTFVALGLTEPDAGSDAGALRTSATPVDGGWQISGEKTSITGVPHAEAVIVFARTGPGAAHGVTALLVPLDQEGVTMSRIPDTGWAPIGRGSITFDGVTVDDTARIGQPGDGFRKVMAGFDFTRPLLTLTAIGAAQAAIDETAEYVAQRTAFGSPLSRFEGVSFPLAEHATKLTAARSLCYQALERRSRGETHTALAAMGKWFGPRAAVEAIHDCLLLFGHYGYTTDSPMEQRLRDVMAVEIADGTAQIQKIIVARELFGRAFVPYGPT